MTLATWLENSGTAVDRRVAEKTRTVDAVYDDELWAILADLGLLASLDAGALTCFFSGVPLTRDNVGGLVGTPEGPRLIADSAVGEPPARR